MSSVIVKAALYSRSTVPLDPTENYMHVTPPGGAQITGNMNVVLNGTRTFGEIKWGQVINEGTFPDAQSTSGGFEISFASRIPPEVGSPNTVIRVLRLNKREAKLKIWHTGVDHVARLKHDGTLTIPSSGAPQMIVLDPLDGFTATSPRRRLSVSFSQLVSAPSPELEFVLFA